MFISLKTGLEYPRKPVIKIVERVVWRGVYAAAGNPSACRYTSFDMSDSPAVTPARYFENIQKPVKNFLYLQA